MDPESHRDQPFVGLDGLCNVLGKWMAEAQTRHERERPRWAEQE